MFAFLSLMSIIGTWVATSSTLIIEVMKILQQFPQSTDGVSSKMDADGSCVRLVTR